MCNRRTASARSAGRRRASPDLGPLLSEQGWPFRPAIAGCAGDGLRSPNWDGESRKYPGRAEYLSSRLALFLLSRPVFARPALLVIPSPRRNATLHGRGRAFKRRGTSPKLFRSRIRGGVIKTMGEV